VLLDAADGVANSTIADRRGVTAVTVRAWRAAFESEGLANWGKVKKGRGRKPQITEDKIAEIVELTTTTTPPGHTHWSCRTMAARVGVSPATVQRIWSELGLAPHRVDTFKVSTDPRFSEKLIDVVGLYLNPPEKAVVLCMDEKSQIQALDRTQASLPLTPGRAGTMTHDHKRNGTTTLFAAMDVLTGTVIGQCLPRHRHEEFLTFLKTIDREVPRELQVNLILDNYSTHKHQAVQRWLRRPPVPPSLHPDLILLAQPGRTLVLRPDRQEPAPRHLSQRPRPDRQHRDLPRRHQRQPRALRVDRHHRIHPDLVSRV